MLHSRSVCVFWLNWRIPNSTDPASSVGAKLPKHTPLLLLQGALLPTVCDPASSESTCTLPSPMVEEAQ